MPPVEKAPCNGRCTAAGGVPVGYDLAPALLAVAALMALVMPARDAAAQAGGSAIRMSTGASLSHSFSDNRDLSSSDRRAGSATQATGSLSLSSSSGRVQGSLDYSLSAQLQNDAATSDRLSNSLSAGFSVTAVEQHAWVDVRARISQQSISAFGVQPDTPFSSSQNVGESRSLSVSPRFRVQLGSFADLNVALSENYAENSGAADSGVRSTGLSASLSGRAGRLNWSVSGHDSRSDRDVGRGGSNRGISASLGYALHYDLSANFRIGREFDTVRSATRGNTNTWGLGLSWTPTNRTSINAQFDHRYFGQARSITISHRMARSYWTYSESRDVSEGISSSGLAYAEAYARLFAELAAQVPDPVLRDQQVRAILDQAGGFVTRAASVASRRNLSVALQGLRGSMVLTAYQSRTERIDAVSTVIDDLSLGALRQHGYTGSVSYRLTPTASANLSYSVRSTPGAGTQPGNELRSLSLGFSSQLALRASLSLSLRHTTFDSPTRPYTENGGQATIGLRF